MSQPSSQTQSNDMPIFVRTLMGLQDTAYHQSSLVGPNETGLPQTAIDARAAAAKAQADACFNRGEWERARDVYMEAAAYLTSDPKFHISVMLNCAAANLKLQNWTDVLCQTSEVLEVDPKSVKALFRSARALNELQNFEAALDCCERGLEVDPHNQPLRQEHQTAERGLRQPKKLALPKKSVLTILREAYEWYHLRVARSLALGTIPIQPTFLPYFDPPTPDDFTKAPLFCSIGLVYPERHAVDKIADFPSNVPLNRLFELLIPGPAGISSSSSTLQSSAQTRIVRAPITSEDDTSGDRTIGHPKNWDPKYEFLSSTVSMYARMHDGESIYIEPGMTLINVFEEAMKLKIEYPEEEKFYIEIQDDIIPIYVFRTDSLALERWEEKDYKSLADLADPVDETGEDINDAKNSPPPLWAADARC
ncbi:hypothetical protein FRC07_004791 [Ceratobasidium sp. 392]|nr:hypothetical protein FRC07_004791 [Ceratobasidium sp. 392]